MSPVHEGERGCASSDLSAFASIPANARLSTNVGQGGFEAYVAIVRDYAITPDDMSDTIHL